MNKHINVLALTRYSAAGPSSRIRAYQYSEYMKNNGIFYNISPMYSSRYIEKLYLKNRHDMSYLVTGYAKRIYELLKSKNYQLIWIESEMFPWSPYLLERIFTKKIPYIVDCDDAIFHKYDNHPLWIIRRLLSSKIDVIMKNAAVVVAGNDYLAARAYEADAGKVEIIPSVVDLEKYPGISEKKEDGKFTIGWIGSPGTTRHLLEAEDGLKQLCKGNGVKIVLVGSGRNPFSGIMATIRDWTEDTEFKEIGNFDVGIMPLPDNPWERGKCGFKLIQYLACGKPVVASPVGANNEIVKHGVNGFLAGNTNQWVEAFLRLKADPSLRRKMGEAGRRMVEEKYCLQVTAPRLHRILLEAAGRV